VGCAEVERNAPDPRDRPQGVSPPHKGTPPSMTQPGRVSAAALRVVYVAVVSARCLFEAREPLAESVGGRAQAWRHMRRALELAQAELSRAKTRSLRNGGFTVNPPEPHTSEQLSQHLDCLAHGDGSVRP
jgi:hypothetical protein